jgi:hypothetical protein
LFAMRWPLPWCCPYSRRCGEACLADFAQRIHDLMRRNEITPEIVGGDPLGSSASFRTSAANQ